MKKGILSFTVVLAFAIVNVLGCFSAAAYGGIGNTHVASSTTVKAAVVDDDFEDRTAGAVASDLYTKPVSGYLNNSTVEVETNGNKYMKVSNYNKVRANPAGDGKYYLDSDRIAFSFDITHPNAFLSEKPVTTSNPYANIYIGGKPVFQVIAKENLTQSPNTGITGVEVRYFVGGSAKNIKNGGKGYYTLTRTSGNWNHVELVLKRVKAANGYKVELEKLNANGVDFNLNNNPYEDGSPNLLDVDWWTEKVEAKNFIELGNYKDTFAIDNILIYSPGEYAAPRVSTSFAPAKRFFIDDNFNDRTDDINKSDYSYKVLKTDETVKVGGEENDKYATIPTSGEANSGFLRFMNKANAVDTDKLALHFKYKLASGGSVDLNFCSSKVLSFAENAITLTGATSAENVTLLENPAVPADGWTYVDLVFERKAAASGDKIMYLTKLAVNGNTVNIGSDKQVRADAKWWDAASFGYLAYNFQLVTRGTCVDDILLYEPAETATGFEIANFNNGTVTIRNANADALNLTGSTLIVAAYDKWDNLLGAAVKEIGANLASGESTSVSFADVTAPTGTAYYKFFAWNNLNEMVPLFTQAEVTAK